MDGNNIFLIQQNQDGSFSNVPFKSAGINVSGNNLTFLSENISFLSTGIRTGDGGSVLAPISRIFGNPIHFSGQGEVNFGTERRSPYISFYNSDWAGNVLDIQKAKRIATGPFVRKSYNDYLINVKDGDGLSIFAVKHFYTYSLPGPPATDKGRPYLGVFCNPDDTTSSTFQTLPYTVTVSGHPTFGSTIRFHSHPGSTKEIDRYDIGKNIFYKNNVLTINTNGLDASGTSATYKNLEITNDGSVLIYKGNYAPDQVLFSTLDNIFTEDFEFSKNLDADSIRTNSIKIFNSGSLTIGEGDSVLEFDSDGFISLYKNGSKILSTEDKTITDWSVNDSDVNIKNNKFYPPTGTVPSSNHPGSQGEMKFDENYIYYCKEDNKWVRTALSEW